MLRKSAHGNFSFLISHFSFLLSLAFLAGCFTVSETEYPTYPMTALPEVATNATVVLRGFETTFIDTIPVRSYQTVYVPGHYGRRHYHHGHYSTVATTTYVEQARESTQFVEQAMDRMEAAGFNVSANPADYIVEVRFDGPYSGENDPGAWRPLLWIGTLLTADKDADTWKAKLKIYDNRTGKLLFTRDYQQEYAVACFSPIPFFGPMCYDRTETNYMKAWCLTALTDPLTSEASAFISGRAVQP